jgi:membrane protease YdiL (CAAX protease family)
MTWCNWLGAIISIGIIIFGFVHLFRTSVNTKQSVSDLMKLPGKITPWIINWPDILILFLLIFGIHLYGTRYINSLFPENFSLTLPLVLVIEYICIYTFYRLYQRFVLPRELRIPLGTKQTKTKEDIALAVSSFFLLIAVVVMLNSIWNLGLILISENPSIFIPVKIKQIQTLYEENPLLLKILISIVCIGIIPYIEEVIFRAGLYRALKSKMGRNTAILLASVLYALFLHNASNFPANIATGIAFCILYERTGNIKAPLLLNTLLAIKTCIIAILLS